MNMIDGNLTGAEVIGRLRKGHMVRRSCWVGDFFIRICNEHGFDEYGNAITYDEVRPSHIYIIATDGYFMHIGTSSQPFINPRAYSTHSTRGADSHFEIATRDGEGIAMLFESDWEDYGFISREDFRALEDELKDVVRSNVKKSHADAIEKAANA